MSPDRKAGWGRGREEATPLTPTPTSGLIFRPQQPTLNLLQFQTRMPRQPDPAPPCYFPSSSPTAQNFPSFPSGQLKPTLSFKPKSSPTSLRKSPHPCHSCVCFLASVLAWVAQA